MANCHILGYFQLHWGQASNSKTQIFVLDFCSIYKTKAQQYDYVFFVIQKSIFFLIFIFNWRIVALQHCVGFCHTTRWIHWKYGYYCIPSRLSLPPTPLSYAGALAELYALHSNFPLASYFTHGRATLSIHPTLSFPLLGPQVHSLCQKSNFKKCKVKECHLLNCRDCECSISLWGEEENWL